VTRPFYENNPFRPPQWRADRVMQMLDHRPKPLRPRGFDDHYVRAYRNFLISYLAAGQDEELRQAAIVERPHVYHAHLLNFAPDVQLRQIAEARLLTSESISDIAKRFVTDEKAIDYFEKLFFNVRDRLHARDWIAKVILGSPQDRAPNKDGIITAGQRGFLYRLFGHSGGPLALDAMIGGLSPRAMPQQIEDVGAWLDDALAQIVRSRAAQAASVFTINKYNVMHIMKLALREKRAAAVSQAGADPRQLDLGKHAENVVTTLDRWKTAGTLPTL
jgi:hypothetical protein